MKVYLAGPFFNNEEKDLIKRLENHLEKRSHNVFSPSRDGGILEKNASLNNRISIFSQNIGAINWCDVVVAIIDNRDSGTIWEMGYAYALGKPIIAYSDKGYTLNVMLAEAVESLALNEDELDESLKGKKIHYTGDIQ